MAKRPVSMSDIATELGLSRSTVSFVLNERNDIQIAEQTRLRVLETASQMGYRRNIAARSLAARRTDLIGLVGDVGAGPFAGDIVLGAQAEAWRRGKFLLVVGSGADVRESDRVFEMLLERRVEGIIVATQAHRALQIPAAAEDVPTVLVHCYDPAGHYPSILPDEEQGGYAAVRRLLDAGHSRIALMNLAQEAAAAAGREAGFRRAMREREVDLDEALVQHGDATARSGFSIASELLALPDPPTALFCGNDRMAMGAYDAIRERGLRVARDVAVVGFDNQEVIAAYLRPALTSVALPFEAMGALGVKAVEQLTRGHSFAGSVVACPLVERDSVA